MYTQLYQNSYKTMVDAIYRCIIPACHGFWRDFNIKEFFYDVFSYDSQSQSFINACKTSDDFYQALSNYELEDDEVYDYNDKLISFDAACNLMDNDITEYMHNNSNIDISTGTGRYQWIETYAYLHAEKYGEEFVPFYGGNW